ncbi:MAG: PPK2 family polyphosphate kinase [Acidobacteriota bacterium]
MSISLRAWERYRVHAGDKPRLGRMRADATDLCEEKKAARKVLKQYCEQINELAAVLAAENQRALLVVLQGMDASGKDGAVKKVFTGVNPQHCQVVSFKPPDREEREHDYLWRIFRALPEDGRIGVFNRSHYEDVVARQGRREIPHSEAVMRLRQIADVERAWVENGISVRKIFLHISRGEQASRFQKRLDNPAKHWKVDESDFEDRKHWPRFQHAYEEALARTTTREAPWYIVPADHKWYRDAAIAGIVLAALKQMKPRLPDPKLDVKKLAAKI